jgi:putative CocE/NonD family hydrolase
VTAERREDLGWAIVERAVRVPTRDGAALVSDVYLPRGARRSPALLERSACGRGAHDARYWTERGYALVVQDVRGRCDSHGAFVPFAHDAADGYDTVAWGAGQDWCDGTVGMLGQSYAAGAQYQLLAAGTPLSLRAAVPMAGPADLRDGWAYSRGGALELGWLLPWAAALAAEGRAAPPFDLLAAQLAASGAADSEPAAGALPQLPAAGGYATLPLSELAGALPTQRWLAEYIAHHDDGAYWWPTNAVRRAGALAVPTLHVTGWYDAFQHSVLAMYGAAAQLAPAYARSAQRLLVGPWAHALPFGAPAAGLDLAGAQEVSLLDVQARWFDHWLRGDENGVADAQPVVYFVLGRNAWAAADRWPPPDAEPWPLYLHSRGRANAVGGDGLLSPAEPGAEEPDRYVYDPEHPVPSLGGASLVLPAGALDQHPVELRDDVLVYTTVPLHTEVEVTGPVRLQLYASSSAFDTDFVARLVDVHEDGTARIVTDGMIRARYRDSPVQPSLLRPGQVYRFELELGATSIAFAPGHRIRLEVTSSSFPRWDRNLNTGLHPSADAAPLRAVQTVFHSSGYPSQLLLPVRRGG